MEPTTVQAGFVTPQARFVTPTLLDDISSPPETPDDEFCANESPGTDKGAPLPEVSCHSSFQPLKKKSIIRSMSYSAFSSHNNGLAHGSNLNTTLLSQSSAMRTGLSVTQEHNLFRTYFMKFVDLLAVREMERLLHNMAPSM